MAQTIRWIQRVAVVIGQVAVLVINWAGAGQAKEIELDEALKGTAAQIRYENGRFVIMKRAVSRSVQQISVLDQQGKLLFDRDPIADFPDCSKLTIWDAAVSGDGLVAVAADMWSTTKQVAAVLVLYQIGKPDDRVRVVRTQPVNCRSIDLDKSGNIWCLGGDVDKRQVTHEDYPVVHQYSSDGRVLARYLPRSSLPPIGYTGPQDKEPYLGGRIGDPKLFRCGDTRMCVWMPSVDIFAEINADGAVQKIPVKIERAGVSYVRVASLPDGRVIGLLPKRDASEGDESRSTPYALNQLDVGAKTWRLVPGERTFTRGSNVLVGADESGFVVWIRTEGKLVWYPLGKAVPN